MEIYKFDCRGNNAPAYGCNKPGDNSGEYIKRKDVERMEILLNATLEILEKCNQGIYVKNVFEETAFYDGVDCDGFCLKEDIKILLNSDI